MLVIHMNNACENSFCTHVCGKQWDFISFSPHFVLLALRKRKSYSNFIKTHCRRARTQRSTNNERVKVRRREAFNFLLLRILWAEADGMAGKTLMMFFLLCVKNRRVYDNIQRRLNEGKRVRKGGWRLICINFLKRHSSVMEHKKFILLKFKNIFLTSRNFCRHYFLLAWQTTKARLSQNSS